MGANPLQSSARRLLFVDHVSKVLGGAEINVLELLEHRGTRERWQIACACAPGSPLASALEKIGVLRYTWGIAHTANELRVVGKRVRPLRKLLGYGELRRA